MAMTAPVRTGPWLESGDRMDQRRFHALYARTPEQFRAELIEGVVYVASPVRYSKHDEHAALVRTWLGVYAAAKADVKVGNEASLVLDDENEVHPDAFLFHTGPGAQLNETAEGYLEGAPELVVEVAASSVSRDLHQKKDAYARNGVREYIVWRVEDGAIDWFELSEGQYRARELPGSGVVESNIFPGLVLEVRAALRLDAAAVLAALAPAS